MTSTHAGAATATSSSATLTVDAPKHDASPEVIPAPISAGNATNRGYDEVSKTRDAETRPAKMGMIDGGTSDIYDRFTKSQKRRIVAIVSYSAFLAPVASSVFLPSIPTMASDLHTTAAVIDYTVAIYILTTGIAPLLWSPLSGFYGRKPIYLVSMPIMAVASIGVAQSRNVGAIIGTRILQGFGGSCVLAVGAGSIGDIYRPTERANAMAWFYSGALMGPSFSPLIAGLFTEYTKETWRSTQYFLSGCAALSFLLTFLFLPETSHSPLPHDQLREERGKRFVWYWFNPLSILGLFRWPNICAITFVSSCTMLETYCFLVPLTTVFQTRYGITNVAVAGCLYIATGGGNFIGARISGPLADRTVRRYIAKRGYRRPEDRLRAALLGSGVIMPLSCSYGWLIQYRAGGLAPPILMMILSGISLLLQLTPVNTYAVDVMQKRSAEVVAVNNFIRYVFAAAASAFVLPLADAIGWGLTMTIAAIISWLATATLLLNIRYGHIWRENANRRYGFVTAHDDERRQETEAETRKDEESAVEQHSEDGHAGEHPSDLVSAPPLKGGAGRRPELSRQLTRTELPGVEQVLQRTVSLSGASVHGGG